MGLTARYQVSVGEIGQCSVPCGGGQAERSIMCTDSASGLPVDMSMCNLKISALPMLVQGCNTQRCSSGNLQHMACFTQVPFEGNPAIHAGHVLLTHIEYSCLWCG